MLISIGTLGPGTSLKELKVLQMVVSCLLRAPPAFKLKDALVLWVLS